MFSNQTNRKTTNLKLGVFTIYIISKYNNLCKYILLFLKVLLFFDFTIFCSKI